MKYIIKIYSIFIILFLFGIADFANAGSAISDDSATNIRYQMEAVNDNDIFGDLEMTDIIATVIKTFLSLLGIIFTVLMLYGGFMWMTAQGDESKVEKAKSTIQSAVIGLIIVVSTYSITYTIFRAL